MTPTADGIAARRDRYEQVAIAVYEPLFRFVRRRANAEVADDVRAEVASTGRWVVSALAIKRETHQRLVDGHHLLARVLGSLGAAIAEPVTHL